MDSIQLPVLLAMVLTVAAYRVRHQKFCNMDEMKRARVMDSPCGTPSTVIEPPVDQQVIDDFDVCTSTSQARLSMEVQLLDLLATQQTRMTSGENSLSFRNFSDLPIVASTNVGNVTDDLKNYFLELSCLGEAMMNKSQFVDQQAEDDLCEIINYVRQELCVLNTASEGRTSSAEWMAKTSCSVWRANISPSSFLIRVAFNNIVKSFIRYLNSIKCQCLQQWDYQMLQH